MTSFIVVPQWQGSGSARAMQLITGTEAIRQDLPRAATTAIDVPLEAGSALDTGVPRASSIDLVRERVRQAVSDRTDTQIVIGGDCAVELGAVEQVFDDGADAALVWFDAHGDLNLPETSPSGAYSGMVLRSLIGDGPALFASRSPVPPARVVLAGARSLDDAEAEFVGSSGIRHLPPSSLDAAYLVDAVAATGATSIYIHVDLDVLDPEAMSGVNSPEPFGIGAVDLVELINALRERFTLIGAGVTGFAPASAESSTDDMGTILRVVGALARPR